ncbi:96a7401f-8c0c-4626-b34c-f4e9083b33be [Thermothielavioides terrestris]|uniref:Peroxin 20 n=2 Tax=Thermothielavioides terrestris TaxID=2587410 RepID=G2QRS1_THETT|nr:uncharacterized protein THITE_2110124 [Thermothielavioides terrestris NRRL 8126]AEO64215.1 hypothetical protein THITE_2110124 [Thermothielavioides terrestris NRRL 8126]SPQ26933.1 96a7401f-8c0c-4626-b34c-f4e9083b33be [Thermothielavioides terrestris]
MADSMCGPSNGAKNLVAHVDRDRTLHQDRLTNAPLAGPGNTFRSQPSFSNSAETAFGHFQQGAAPAHATFGPNLDLNVMHPIVAYVPAVRPHLHSAPAAPAPMGNIGVGAGAPATRLVSATTPGNPSHQEWVAEFASMQLGPGTAGATAAMPSRVHPGPMPAMHPAMNPQPAPFPMPMPMANAAPSALLRMQNPAMSAGTQQPQTELSQDGAAAAKEQEAFDLAFAAYDKDIFEREVAEWTEKQKLANSEFAEEQDKWMAKHGPRSEPPARAQKPSADEMEVIDAKLEELAQEQDKRQAEDDLARAALDIVNSVADNTSRKFKDSQFFALMRRIANHEVVVEGDDLVDVATKEPIDPNYDYDKIVDSDDDSDSAKPAKTSSAGTAPVVRSRLA